VFILDECSWARTTRHNIGDLSEGTHVKNKSAFIDGSKSLGIFNDFNFMKGNELLVKKGEIWILSHKLDLLYTIQFL